MKLERTLHGARLVHDGHVVSELPARPGPTHSVFDPIAALASLHPNPKRVAMLGFAAGGTVAPLRFLGVSGQIDAVDLSVAAVPTFRRLTRAWSGDVHVTRDDAVKWIASHRRCFDVVIEDLSMQIPNDVTKPPVSYEVLPELVARSVRRGGFAIVNVLPVAGWSWRRLLDRIAAPFADARVVTLSEYDNRLLLLGSNLPDSKAISHHVARALRRLDSELAGTTSVRRLTRRA